MKLVDLYEVISRDSGKRLRLNSLTDDELIDIIQTDLDTAHSFPEHDFQRTNILVELLSTIKSIREPSERVQNYIIEHGGRWFYIVINKLTKKNMQNILMA